MESIKFWFKNHLHDNWSDNDINLYNEIDFELKHNKIPIELFGRLFIRIYDDMLHNFIYEIKEIKRSHYKIIYEPKIEKLRKYYNPKSSREQLIEYLEGKTITNNYPPFGRCKTKEQYLYCFNKFDISHFIEKNKDNNNVLALLLDCNKPIEELLPHNILLPTYEKLVSGTQSSKQLYQILRVHSIINNVHIDGILDLLIHKSKDIFLYKWKIYSIDRYYEKNKIFYNKYFIHKILNNTLTDDLYYLFKRHLLPFNFDLEEKYVRILLGLRNIPNDIINYILMY